MQRQLNGTLEFLTKGRMACWPANATAAFFVVLIIFDIAKGSYNDLPFHGVLGILATLVFWLVCITLGQSVSAAILVVPAIFLFVFLFTIWFIGESFQKRGCCMSCGDSSCSGCKAPPPPKPPAKKCEPPLNLKQSPF